MEVASRQDRVRFFASVNLFSDKGRLPPSLGHWLGKQFSSLYEFKTRGCRLFAFRYGANYYVGSGADKTKDKQQSRDYNSALELRNRVLPELSSEFPNESKGKDVSH